MSDTSSRLALPYLQASQAQKHVTHNEALKQLDRLVQLAVAGFGAETPPVAPAPGEIHALGALPTGAWAGQAGRLAAWDGAAWGFIAPQPGWRAWGLAEAELRVFDGSAWVAADGGHQNLAGLGIGTSWDATNRLAVAADASLFNHDGADHRLKLNKAAAADTAALLYQVGYSGRAEIGLAGDDDFSIKVSPDGSGWTDALVLDSTTGTATGAAVQSSADDTTAGRLLTVGAFGLGENELVPSLDDIDGTSTAAGWYHYTSEVPNHASLPVSAQGNGLMRVERRAEDTLVQTVMLMNLSSGAFMRGYASSAWGEWVQVTSPVNSRDWWEDVSVADDAVATLEATRNFGFVEVLAEGASAFGGLCYFDIAGSPDAIAYCGGTNFAASTGTPTGTTGTDGAVTIFATNGTLYLENRYGASRNFRIKYSLMGV